MLRSGTTYVFRVHASSFNDLTSRGTYGVYTLLTLKYLTAPFRLLELPSEPLLLHLSELHFVGASQFQRYKAR